MSSQRQTLASPAAAAPAMSTTVTQRAHAGASRSAAHPAQLTEPQQNAGLPVRILPARPAHAGKHSFRAEGSISVSSEVAGTPKCAPALTAAEPVVFRLQPRIGRAASQSPHSTRIPPSMLPAAAAAEAPLRRTASQAELLWETSHCNPRGGSCTTTDVSACTIAEPFSPYWRSRRSQSRCLPLEYLHREQKAVLTSPPVSFQTVLVDGSAVTEPGELTSVGAPREEGICTARVVEADITIRKVAGTPLGPVGGREQRAAAMEAGMPLEDHGVPPPCWSTQYDSVVRERAEAQVNGSSRDVTSVQPDKQVAWIRREGSMEKSSRDPPASVAVPSLQRLHSEGARAGDLATSSKASPYHYGEHPMEASSSDSMRNRGRRTGCSTSRSNSRVNSRSNSSSSSRGVNSKGSKSCSTGPRTISISSYNRAVAVQRVSSAYYGGEVIQKPSALIDGVGQQQQHSQEPAAMPLLLTRSRRSLSSARSTCSNSSTFTCRSSSSGLQGGSRAVVEARCNFLKRKAARHQTELNRLRHVEQAQREQHQQQIGILQQLQRTLKQQLDVQQPHHQRPTGDSHCVKQTAQSKQERSVLPWSSQTSKVAPYGLVSHTLRQRQKPQRLEAKQQRETSSEGYAGQDGLFSHYKEVRLRTQSFKRLPALLEQQSVRYLLHAKGPKPQASQAPFSEHSSRILASPRGLGMRRTNQHIENHSSRLGSQSDLGTSATATATAIAETTAYAELGPGKRTSQKKATSLRTLREPAWTGRCQEAESSHAVEVAKAHTANAAHGIRTSATHSLPSSGPVAVTAGPQTTAMVRKTKQDSEGAEYMKICHLPETDAATNAHPNPLPETGAATSAVSNPQRATYARVVRSARAAAAVEGPSSVNVIPSFTVPNGSPPSWQAVPNATHAFDRGKTAAPFLTATYMSKSAVSVNTFSDNLQSPPQLKTEMDTSTASQSTTEPWLTVAGDGQEKGRSQADWQECTAAEDETGGDAVPILQAGGVRSDTNLTAARTGVRTGACAWSARCDYCACLQQQVQQMQTQWGWRAQHQRAALQLLSEIVRSLADCLSRCRCSLRGKVSSTDTQDGCASPCCETSLTTTPPEKPQVAMSTNKEAQPGQQLQGHQEQQQWQHRTQKKNIEEQDAMNAGEQQNEGMQTDNTGRPLQQHWGQLLLLIRSSYDATIEHLLRGRSMSNSCASQQPRDESLLHRVNTMAETTALISKQGTKQHVLKAAPTEHASQAIKATTALAQQRPLTAVASGLTEEPERKPSKGILELNIPKESSTVKMRCTREEHIVLKSPETSPAAAGVSPEAEHSEMKPGIAHQLFIINEHSASDSSSLVPHNTAVAEEATTALGQPVKKEHLQLQQLQNINSEAPVGDPATDLPAAAADISETSLLIHPLANAFPCSLARAPSWSEKAPEWLCARQQTREWLQNQPPEPAADHSSTFLHRDNENAAPQQSKTACAIWNNDTAPSSVGNTGGCSSSNSKHPTHSIGRNEVISHSVSRRSSCSSSDVRLAKGGGGHGNEERQNEYVPPQGERTQGMECTMHFMPGKKASSGQEPHARYIVAVAAARTDGVADASPGLLRTQIPYRAFAGRLVAVPEEDILVATKRLPVEYTNAANPADSRSIDGSCLSERAAARSELARDEQSVRGGTCPSFVAEYIPEGGSATLVDMYSEAYNKVSGCPLPCTEDRSSSVNCASCSRGGDAVASAGKRNACDEFRNTGQKPGDFAGNQAVAAFSSPKHCNSTNPAGVHSHIVRTGGCTTCPQENATSSKPYTVTFPRRGNNENTSMDGNAEFYSWHGNRNCSSESSGKSTAYTNNHDGSRNSYEDDRSQQACGDVHSDGGHDSNKLTVLIVDRGDGFPRADCILDHQNSGSSPPPDSGSLLTQSTAYNGNEVPVEEANAAVNRNAGGCKELCGGCTGDDKYSEYQPGHEGTNNQLLAQAKEGHQQLNQLSEAAPAKFLNTGISTLSTKSQLCKDDEPKNGALGLLERALQHQPLVQEPLTLAAARHLLSWLDSGSSVQENRLPALETASNTFATMNEKETDNSYQRAAEAADGLLLEAERSSVLSCSEDQGFFTERGETTRSDDNKWASVPQRARSQLMKRPAIVPRLHLENVRRDSSDTSSEEKCVEEEDGEGGEEESEKIEWCPEDEEGRAAAVCGST